MAQVQTDDKGKPTGTVRQHYAMLVEKGRAEFRARLEGPGLPEPLRPVWALYQEVSEGRSGGGMGPSVLTWGDLLAWQAVTGGTLDGWEARALFAIDAAVRAGLTTTG